MFRFLLWLCLLGGTVNVVQAQQRPEGRVSDRQGRPLPRATILVLPDSTVLVTDDLGRFQLPVTTTGRGELVVTYVGYAAARSIYDLQSGRLPDIRLEEASYTFDAVELIGTWARSSAPVTYTSLDRTEIEKNNMGQDVPYILQWTPSAVVSSDAGTGIGYTGMRIRGTDPTRINVTINGVPLNDAESQGVFWVDLPDFASSARQIQIQRGAGSSTNGAGAFGATINLSTLNVEDKAHASAGLTAGSFGTRRAWMQAGTGLIDGRFILDGRFSKISSEGYIDRASADLDSWFASGAWIGSDQILRLNVFSGNERTYQAWNGVPAQYIDDPVLRRFNTAGLRSDGSAYPDEVDQYRQTHYQLIHQWNPAPDLYTNLTAHYTRGIGYFEQFRELDSLHYYDLMPVALGDSTLTVSDLVRRRWLDNHFYGLIGSVDKDWNAGASRVTVGGGYNRYLGDHYGEVIWARYASNGEKDHRYYFNAANKTDFNIYTRYLQRLGASWNVYLDLQYRTVGYHYEGDNNDDRFFSGDAQYHFFNPRAGLSLDLSTASQLYLSLAAIGREPNRDDFINSAANQVPRPEYLYNPELGWRRRWTNATIQANAYLMYYRDQLAVTGAINDVGEYNRVNIPESYRAGVEIEAAWRWKGFHAGTALTFSTNKVVAFTEYIDDWDEGVQLGIAHRNTDLALSPSVIGNLELGYTLRDLRVGNWTLTPELSLLTKYVGRQYLDNTSNPHTALDPYTYSDLRLRIPVQVAGGSGLVVSFWINNLFDSQYVSNGWAYRYRSLSYDPVADDPFSAAEGAGIYNQRGLYPQAGRQWMMSIQYTL